MFISGFQTVIRERVVFASGLESGEMGSAGESRIEKYEERIPTFGVVLPMFNDVEQSQFIQKLKNICQRQQLTIPEWAHLSPLFHDPFYSGLVARQVLASLPLPDRPEDLLNAYIRSRCIDNGASRDGDSRFTALVDLAGVFVDDSLSLRTFVPLGDARKVVQPDTLAGLLNSGIVHDDVATEYGEPVVLFRHDRVFEYAISLFLQRKFARENVPAADQLVFVVQNLISLSRHHTRDYWLRIVNLTLRRFGAEIRHDDGVGRARFIALNMLDRIPLTRKATSILLQHLGDADWGYALTDSIQKGSRDAIDEYLSLVMRDGASDEAIRNAVLIARAATVDVAFGFLRWASLRVDHLVAIRAAYVLGELGMPASTEILEGLLDRYPEDDGVLNSALWALGKIG